MKESKFEIDELISRFLSGDGQTLEPIMKLLQGPVCSQFLKRRIPADDVPDVAAAFFSELFDSKLSRYKTRSGASFWAWLSVVLRSYAADWHRARSRNLEFAASPLIEDFQDSLVEEEAAAPSQRMLILAEVFGEVFARLSPQEQDLLRMREIAEMEYEEIVLKLYPESKPEERSIVVGRLKTQFHRAKEKIRTMMERDPRTPRDLFTQSPFVEGEFLHEHSELEVGRHSEHQI